MPRIARAQNLRLKYLTPTANKSLSYYTALLESHLFVAYFSLTDFLNLALVSKNIYHWLNFYQHPLFLSYLERTVDDHFSYKNARMVYMFCPESRLRNYRYAGPIGRLNLRANLCVNFPERICVTREALGQIERLASAHHLDANNAVLLPDASPVITEQSMSLLLDQAALLHMSENNAVKSIVCRANLAYLKLFYSDYGAFLCRFMTFHLGWIAATLLMGFSLTSTSQQLSSARAAYNGTLLFMPDEATSLFLPNYCGDLAEIFDADNCQQISDLYLSKAVFMSCLFNMSACCLFIILTLFVEIFSFSGFNKAMLCHYYLPQAFINYFSVNSINVDSLTWPTKIDELSEFSLAYDAFSHYRRDHGYFSIFPLFGCIAFLMLCASFGSDLRNGEISFAYGIDEMIFTTCFEADFEKLSGYDYSFWSKVSSCTSDGIFINPGSVNTELAAFCRTVCELRAGGFPKTVVFAISLSGLFLSLVSLMACALCLSKQFPCFNQYMEAEYDVQRKIRLLSDILFQVHTEQREQANQLTLLAADDNNIELGVIPTNVEQPNDEAGDEMVVNIEMAVTAITAIDTQRASIQSPIAFLSAARAGLGRSSNPYAGLMSIDEEKSDEEKSDDEDSDFDLDLELGNASRVRGVLPGANIH